MAAGEHIRYTSAHVLCERTKKPRKRLEADTLLGDFLVDAVVLCHEAKPSASAAQGRRTVEVLQILSLVRVGSFEASRLEPSARRTPALCFAALFSLSLANARSKDLALGVRSRDGGKAAASTLHWRWRVACIVSARQKELNASWALLGTDGCAGTF